jgi:hypothetical protein
MRIAYILACTLVVGCGKPHSRDFTADFEVRPSPDRQNVTWSLKFTRDDFNNLTASMPDDLADQSRIDAAVHEKVREMIRAGLESNQLTGCPTHQSLVVKIKGGGLSFYGSCPVSPVRTSGP